jgi:hypothetical protein
MGKAYRCSLGLVLVSALACGPGGSNSASSEESSSALTARSPSVLAQRAGRPSRDPHLMKALVSVHGRLASPHVKTVLKEALDEPSTTPFERGVIGLHPVVGRMAELSKLNQRTEYEEAEFDSLLQQIKENPVAVRMQELTRSSPMTCTEFEKAASKEWLEGVLRIPELAGVVSAFREQCASGAGVIAGLWSGFAHPDWHSRVILGDEELPRSESTVRAVARVAGPILIVTGVIVAVVVPGGQLVGALIAVAGGAITVYGNTGNIFVTGGGCLDANNQPAPCSQSSSQQLIAANGCLMGVSSCASSSTCGDSSVFCTYGCCEAFSTGLSKQESGLSGYAVFLETPAGYVPNEVGIWASRSAKINDRARVMRADGTGAPVITSTVESRVELGTDTFVGDVVDAGNAMLRDRAQIAGALTVSGTVSYGNASTVRVSGPTTLGAAASARQLPPSRLFWMTTFKDSGLSPVSLEPDQTRTLAPGDYGNVVVKPRAHLVLQPGVYHFDGLSMDATSFLDIPANVLTRVDVRNTLNLSGTVVQQGTAQTLMITYVGTYAFVTQKFAGTLVAPYALVNLHVAGTEMRASIWGLSVELYEGGRVRLANTSVWDLVSHDLGG